MDCGGSTPFMWAACKEREGVVKKLLGRDDVNSDKPDNHGRELLCRTAYDGHEGIPTNQTTTAKPFYAIILTMGTRK